MAYSRPTAPLRTLDGAELDQALTGIGMRFAVVPAAHPPIEDALYFASQLGMESDDYRVLGVVCTWIDVHAERINADRLTRLVDACVLHPRTRAFWAAVGQWQRRDRRFGRLAALRAVDDRLDLFAGTEFQVRRRGEHPWFAETCLRVPAGTLRSRETDVLTPQELARVHEGYRQRVIQGPSYRADMWAALLVDASLSTSELARRTYGSFATAWEVVRDWRVVMKVAA